MRPYVMTIAGHDPSGGAGLTADCKTFEQHKTVGLSVCTANTVQTESEFVSVNWLPHDLIMQQVEKLYIKYQPQVVKVGLIESFSLLLYIAKWFKLQNPEIIIIWDPVLKSTTGFEFHQKTEGLNDLLKYVTLVTPNMQEAMQLFGSKNPKDIKIFCHGNPTLSVLLKGGHAGQKGTDLLISQKEIFTIPGEPFTGYEKHGTGCILSSAIAANIAKGSELKEACIKGKKYVEKAMLSNHGLLAYHNI
ncbi:MAG: hydroxymethylpyrimidine/phosphomethylpyrimidine kinase [Prolixibacteraceae bacterium]|nr:hydroxymethylpyrimidine/phosphomethylpyrimidine kinase [Prolixibacteraceae bacterium]MBN2649469.1 hydroxymethylpyrimidine/phosphomethylpyrimidine kinase [Prolixibacteraceae bacterium]